MLFFGWLAWKDRVKTSVFLKRIGVLSSSTSSLCLFCKNEVKTTKHVLLFYPLVWKLWSEIVSWCDLKWAIPSSVEGLFQWWASEKYKYWVHELWKIIPKAVLWSVWKLRNECLFKGAQPDFANLSERVKVQIAIWAKLHMEGINYLVHNLVSNLKQSRYILYSVVL